MGWKWNDIRPQVEEIVRAKKQELADKLEELAVEEDNLGSLVTHHGGPHTADFHVGRADAFREVKDAVKP